MIRQDNFIRAIPFSEFVLIFGGRRDPEIAPTQENCDVQTKSMRLGTAPMGMEVKKLRKK